MSSEVHAKCVNSSTFASSAFWAKRCLRTYSTAFTSWLVVRSTSFTASASSGEKVVASSSKRALASAENGGTSSTCVNQVAVRQLGDSVRTGLSMRAETLPFASGHLRDARQELQPPALDHDAEADEPVLGEGGAETRELGAVAAIEGSDCCKAGRERRAVTPS